MPYSHMYVCVPCGLEILSHSDMRAWPSFFPRGMDLESQINVDVELSQVVNLCYATGTFLTRNMYIYKYIYISHTKYVYIYVYIYIYIRRTIGAMCIQHDSQSFSASAHDMTRPAVSCKVHCCPDAKFLCRFLYTYWQELEAAITQGPIDIHYNFEYASLGACHSWWDQPTSL